MIFLTVGTLFSFDRLVEAIDNLVYEEVITDTVFGQIGPNGFKPRNFDWVEVMEKDLYNQKVAQSKALLSHAGMGSIEIALKHEKPILVLPRMKKYREHVNDHQVGTARNFEKDGHILAAYSIEELPEQLEKLSAFIPKKRVSNVDNVVQIVAEFLSTHTK